MRLTREFLDVAGLARNERQWHDTRDVHLRAVDMHVEAELLADVLDVLQTLLVVGAGTTDPDLDLVLKEEGCDFPQSANDTLEGRCDVGEVGNTTTDEQNLTLLVLRSAEHEVEDSAGVVEGLSLSGSTRVLTIVGELAGEAGRGDCVGVDNGCTTTSNEGPYTTSGVENGELERRTSLSVHLCDVGLFLAHLTTERSGELHWWADIDGSLSLLDGSKRYAESTGAASNSPLRTALEFSGLVKLRSEIQEVNLRRGGVSVGNDNERVDLEVAAGMLAVHDAIHDTFDSRELAVDVDGV